jgi:hypothetical protein
MATNGPGRPKVPQRRLGKHQAKTVQGLMRVIRRFALISTDVKQGETKLNARLIEALKKADDRVVNTAIASVSFIGETYRPECTLSDGGAYVLLAVECKKLHDHSAKRLFKEGLAQAHMYLTKSKVVALVLYDFTSSLDYKKAFGAGNTTSSRMASRLRENGVHIVVCSV